MSDLCNIGPFITLLPQLGLSPMRTRIVLEFLDSCCCHWLNVVQSDSRRLEQYTNQQLQTRELLKVYQTNFFLYAKYLYRLAVKKSIPLTFSVVTFVLGPTLLTSFAMLKPSLLISPNKLRFVTTCYDLLIVLLLFLRLLNDVFVNSIALIPKSPHSLPIFPFLTRATMKRLCPLHLPTPVCLLVNFRFSFFQAYV